VNRTVVLSIQQEVTHVQEEDLRGVLVDRLLEEILPEHLVFRDVDIGRHDVRAVGTATDQDLHMVHGLRIAPRCILTAGRMVVFLRKWR